MSKRLSIYRELPEPLPMRAREHAAICLWCIFRASYPDCDYPHGIHRPRYKQNPDGRCPHYRPTFGTRILQALRLRPYIERPPEP